MSRQLVWILAVLLFFHILACSAVVVFSLTFDAPKSFPPDSRIVILSHFRKRVIEPRVAAGIKVYREKGARDVILTGGSAAELMAKMARDSGVDPHRIIVDAKAKSTLQNALFTLDILGDKETPVILVTDRIHLLRAGVSFRWAGFRHITLVPSDPRPGSMTDLNFRRVGLEGGKWLFNIARMGGFSLLKALGVPPTRYIGFLD